MVTFDQLDYSRRPDPVIEPYPAPKVTSRDGVQPPEKQAVKDLIKMATALGWKVVKNSYAMGHMPHAIHGTPGQELESIAVRLERDGHWMVAVYRGKAGTTWTWDTLYHYWPEADGIQPIKSITAFRAAL